LVSTPSKAAKPNLSSPVKNSPKQASSFTKESPMSKERAHHTQNLMSEILEKLISMRSSSDDRLLSEVFMELPSTKLYPDYYTTIASPISFDMIQKNIKKKHLQYTIGILRRCQQSLRKCFRI